MSINSKHFDVFEVFKDVSYAKRYDIILRHLVQESVYDSSPLLPSSKEEEPNGNYMKLDEPTGLKRLISGLAAHVTSAFVLS